MGWTGKLDHRDTETQRDLAIHESSRRFHAASKVAEGGYGDRGDREIREDSGLWPQKNTYLPISIIPISPLIRLGQRHGHGEGIVIGSACP